ncbi:MAG: YHS domain-containing protein [Desulfobacterales bacterium]|nr:YHS domain-containing protein [Desulfobacterales bacterium]MBF0396012.1 YHS domain-containing protein [Desulfobacterales bacterium]
MQQYKQSERMERTSRHEIDDVMIKDPYCEVYFPQRTGIKAIINGKEFFFCSKECRDKFLANKGDEAK